MTFSIIHDCDPENDDAVGILVAAGHPNLELLAVTTDMATLKPIARHKTQPLRWRR